MAAGAPVVATDVSGIPELVEHEVNGLLVAPEDPRGARRRAAAPARGPRADATRLAATAARPSRERFDGERLAQRARRRCSGRRWRGERADRDPPAPRASASTSTSTATARWPRPVAAGRFTFAGETRELGPRARLAARRPARGRGVADRLGQVLLRARPRRRVPRHRRRALPGRVGAARRELRARRSRRTHDPSEVTARRILNWIYAWQRLPEVSDGSRTALVESLREQARHVRANLTPERNHRTLELYALLIAALALPELDARPARVRGRELHEQPAGRLRRRRRAPRALARTTT